MFLSIYHNQSGEEYVRRIAPNESLDLRTHVNQWAEKQGYAEVGLVPSFSQPGSHIPNGCGEYQAELRHTKKPGVVCWNSEPFFMVESE